MGSDTGSEAGEQSNDGHMSTRSNASLPPMLAALGLTPGSRNASESDNGSSGVQMLTNPTLGAGAAAALGKPTEANQRASKAAASKVAAPAPKESTPPTPTVAPPLPPGWKEVPDAASGKS